MKRILLVIYIALVSFTYEMPQVIFNNTVWKDTAGNDIKAQGGCIIQSDGLYHWFGPDFGGTGDTKFHAINHYISTDLKNWAKISGGMVTPGMPTIPFEIDNWVGRPWILKNAITNKFIMVVEWGGKAPYRNRYAFLSADSLTADNAWTYQGVLNRVVASDGHQYNLGDLGAYQDGTDAWLAFTFDKGKINGAQCIRKLDPTDYLSLLPATKGNYVEFNMEHPDKGDWRVSTQEAASIVKRESTYYYFTSVCSGWKSSETRYRTASKIAGPWSNAAIVKTSPNSLNSFDTQHDFVLPIKGSSGTTYVYFGDRWSNYSGVNKDTGLYQWYPITFDSNGVPTIKGNESWLINTSDLEDPK